MNLSPRFARNAKRLIEKVGKPVELWAEVFVEASSTTSAGYEKPRRIWPNQAEPKAFARLEAYTPSRYPQIEAGVQGKIPEWVAIMSTDAFCNLPPKSRWWLVVGGQRYNPTHPEAADMASGGVIEVGLKGGR